MSITVSSLECPSKVSYCTVYSQQEIALQIIIYHQETLMNDKRQHNVHMYTRAERYCHFSITIDTKATIHDTE